MKKGLEVNGIANVITLIEIAGYQGKVADQAELLRQAKMTCDYLKKVAEELPKDFEFSFSWHEFRAAWEAKNPKLS